MLKIPSPYLTNPTDDIIRGCLYAIGMGLPIFIGYWSQLQTELAFVAMGTMFSLRLDPRSRPKPQALAIIGGMGLMLASATLGAYLTDHRQLAIATFLFISYLAGQPKPEQAYLSLLGKFTAAALLLTEMGIPASFDIAMAYLLGAIFAVMLTIVQDKYFPPSEVIWNPGNEWHKLMAGDTNGPLFGFTLPLTILAALVTAEAFHAHHSVWAGLTVLFVMHVNDAVTWRKIRQRTLGTLLGVILSYGIIVFLPSYSLAIIIFGLAFFLPIYLKKNYLIFSMLMTACVLIVIDIATLHQGGDIQLIKWRFLDTLIGSLWVATSLTILRLFKTFWPNHNNETSH